MNSIWSETWDAPKFNSLNENLSTDVLIIGGGLCGILCAYFLKQQGIDYILVEAEKIGNGITKNTTAKITSQHGLIYNQLIKKAGKEKARMYLDANQLALSKYRDICKNIDCDFETKDAYTYSLKSRQKIEDEVTAVNYLGLKAEFVDKLPLPFDVEGAILFKDQAQFNPLKFLEKITKELNIYEKTFIRDIRENMVLTDTGSINAKNIIVTTHFPFINTHGSYFLKMYQHRSYVIAIDNAPNLNGMFVDESKTGMSFRNYKDLLLIGGGDHRTGKNGGNWRELREFKEKYYTSSIEKYYWATQDCMTLDSVPYIGHYSKNTPNLFVATGFNKWGMTSSMVSAMILTDMVSGKKNEFKDVFSPQRSILQPQLLANGFNALIGLLTPSTKRCPHLGCSLKWNKIEHTWDCPCHGSRFEENGKLIDNPATGGKKF